MNDTTHLPAEVAAASPKSISNAGMTLGSGIASLIPQNLDDVYRLSKALAMSGNFCRKMGCVVHGAVPSVFISANSMSRCHCGR